MSPDPAALAPFADAFARPGFTFGRWRSGEAKDGNMQLPWFELSAEASAFVEVAYVGGWVLRDFAWSAWTGGNEVRRLRTIRLRWRQHRHTTLRSS